MATKLFIPRLRQRLVARQRLFTRLQDALTHPLTLVSAPAGFGKTTLVSSWVQSRQQPVAWLSLDEADNDPARFLNYFVAALQHIAPTVGQTVQSALAAANPPPSEVLMGVLANELLALAAELLLVLDDFHTIDAAAVHEAIQTLVAHQPPQLHLLIVTREDPQLPLARLRARGQLVELRAHDLRFTPQEGARFLQESIGLALEPQEIAALDAQIEGWIAGLQLAALSLHNHAQPSELIASLAGGHHFILSYLTEEVLRQLTPDVQSFLLYTSVLSRLTGPLCDALTGRTDSAAVLEQLYTANIFVIPLDEGHRWVRYHHLFADLLRNQLHRTDPQRASNLHVRASLWYEQQGLAGEAIEHALAAADYPRTVELLESHARRIVLQGYAQTVETFPPLAPRPSPLPPPAPRPSPLL